jgi:hypothetical protein
MISRLSLQVIALQRGNVSIGSPGTPGQPPGIGERNIYILRFDFFGVTAFQMVKINARA